MKTRYLSAILLCGCMGIASSANAQFVIDSLDGEVTQHEVDAYISAVSATVIPTSQWSYGGSTTRHNYLADESGGTTLEGINRMFEITKDIPNLASEQTQLLDLAIKWSDAWLTHRNDLPLGEHRVMWTGKVDPIWPPDDPKSASAKYAACEVGETVGILAYTAYNIVNTPAIWSNTVPDGDPNHFGTTYLARAKTYISMLEFSMDNFFNNNFLDQSTLFIRHPNSSAYNALPSNNVNAWNRSMMFMHAYQTLGQIHEALGDNPSKAAMYKTVVVNWVNLFVQNALHRTAPDGTPVYDWGYGNYGDETGKLTGEQIGIHAQYDIWGLTRAYRAGYTSATAAQMKTYADTVVHEMQISPGVYDGTVDNTSSQTYNYLPAGFFYLSPYNAAIYKPAAQATIASGHQTNDAGETANILWVKHWIAMHSSVPSAPVFSPGAGTYAGAQSVSITSSGATTIYYTTNGTTPTTSSTVYTGPVTIASTTTLKAVATNNNGSSTVASATYTISIPLTSAPTFTPGGGTYTSAQNVSITSATSGASIRYTTDGSTPSETAGIIYSSPVNISNTASPTTLQAIAYKAGFTDSTVSSATYTISINNSPIILEAENLSPVGTGATVSTSADANASNGIVEFLNATGTGQSMTLTTPSISAGTYQVQLRYKTNTSRGQHTVKIDGTQVGGTIDQYATTSGYTTATLGTVTLGSSGAHTIVMTVTGKNSASTQFYITADSFTLTPMTPPPPTYNFEAENMSPVGTGATASTSSDANASGGIVEFLNSTGTGQSMTLTTPSISAGTYQVQLRYKTNTSRGQHNVVIDGTQVGGTIDQYLTTVGYTTVTLGTVTFSSASAHTIAMTVTGKRSASTQFYITADKFTLVGQ